MNIYRIQSSDTTKLERLMNIKDVRLDNMLLLIEESGSQVAFCERVGMQPTEASQIKSAKNKRNIGNELARRIEKAFNKDEYWLDLSRQKVDLSSTSVVREQMKHYAATSNNNGLPPSHFGAVESWDNSTPLGVDEVEIPYYMDIELAAGDGLDTGMETTGLKLRFGKSFLRRKMVSEESAACVRVTGSSMQPRLYDGDVVAVNLADTKVRDGNTYAINHDGLLRIKMLSLLPGGKMKISSYNADEHPDEIISAEERMSIKVIGRIFHSMSDW